MANQQSNKATARQQDNMVKAAGPDLKRYMDKRLSLKLNGNRKVTGVLRGFDQFMNVTLDETVEEVSATESNRIGMVVRRILPVDLLVGNECMNGKHASANIACVCVYIHMLLLQVIRGNSIVQFECLERL